MYSGFVSIGFIGSTYCQPLRFQSVDHEVSVSSTLVTSFIGSANCEPVSFQAMRRPNHAVSGLEECATQSLPSALAVSGPRTANRCAFRVSFTSLECPTHSHVLHRVRELRRCVFSGNAHTNNRLFAQYAHHQARCQCVWHEFNCKQLFSDLWLCGTHCHVQDIWDSHARDAWDDNESQIIPPCP